MTSPKLFISYPSESWNFAQRIAENLAPRIEQAIFIDYRSIDQVDFAKAILSNLKQCDAMLLIITEFTFADIHRDNDWLRVEIRTALEHEIPIVLVRENGLLPPMDVPDDIQNVRRSQGIAFYREYFASGIHSLVEFLLRIGVVTARISGTSAEIIQPTPPPSDTQNIAPNHKINGKKDNITKVALLPAPFDWIEIPGGRGTLKTNEPDVTLEIPTQSYAIAKYPVTNAQYAKFIEAGGYDQQKWWTAQVWGMKQSGKWTAPRYWDDGDFNSAEQPVIGVTWFEAVAFCLWLSDATGTKIMLPTDAQWQYAAQGSDGRDYPWGNEWVDSSCNSNVDFNGIGKTTPVRQYEGKGDSPFGVVDMAGNVWEWCLTDEETGNNDINENVANRVLRGGSWYNYDFDNLRAPYRFSTDSFESTHNVGFRIART